MALTYSLFDLVMGAVKDAWSKEVVEDIAQDTITLQLYNSRLSELNQIVNSIAPYASKADESYRLLLVNNLTQVPAIDLYDGDYVEELNNLILTAESVKDPTIVQNQINKTVSLATEIQTYLNEETSDLEAAKLWDSKFIKGIQSHIPPHLKKGEMGDNIMSEVMRAYRNWASFAQASIDLYGSQRLINATYEAVAEGKDAMEYIKEIIDLNQRDSAFGGGLHEKVIVPHARFFGSGFFF